MPETLLVANRGEIARRILRTARAMGLRTAAVFSDADRGAPHVREADTAFHLGPSPVRESYLAVDRLLAAVEATGAWAVHPGYGFLSEDAAFARAVEAAGARFVGPAPEHLEAFGAKHTARRLARAAGLPMSAGTELLADLDEAVAAAETIGYPVILKATGGGGGIGMRACWNADELRAAFESVQRTASASFASTGVFLERFVEHARHLEVQVFGDGAGRVLVLGDRDCTLQRRNQKVVEEAPAPNLPDALREQVHAAARRLGESVSYRSAGTVELVYDADRGETSFLEVNARLQVEHPVTEAVLGIDLVEWMLRLAQGDAGMFDRPAPAPRGHAVEARVYAEDPARGYRPGTGTASRVQWPAGEGIRVDTWVETGTEVTGNYDPMLAKVVAHAGDRATAFARLTEALDATRVDGLDTNLGQLRALGSAPEIAAAEHTTKTLERVVDPSPRIEVLRPGTLTTVQDWPGRLGLWQVGVPPSGPMDDRSFRLGNLALGNPEGAPGLECTLAGPALRFSAAATVCITGAAAPATVDGRPVPMWEPVAVLPGQVLDVGAAPGPGLRTYVLVAGGLDVPAYLDSAATFTLGGFGGHAGRTLVTGDVLRPAGGTTGPTGVVPAGDRPLLGAEWELRVTEGPHAAPEFFTRADVETLYASEYLVHFNSSRTGVRLVGPKPAWARPDGGEAGLHPSNIHDTPYSVGALDFTGDTPILLGPDGPSLGGFVCPVTVVTGERWKLGQLRPGDAVRFVPVRAAEAPALRSLRGAPRLTGRGDGDDGVLARRPGTGDAPEVTYRRSGDDNVLVEYGPMVLDLGLRARVHALSERLASEGLAGVVDVTPGIRSLQVHVDPEVLDPRRLLGALQAVEDDLPAVADLEVPSRHVRLPLSWDDPATREAIARYMAGVRDDAPWCPWNIEFIRRANGLDSVDDVHRVVFDAEYLVLGLGDVYLGAPVATPLDPRHRLRTTKYNPARTWTPENAVGLGGAYLCIYGMEGPGGYQFVGRTTQVWTRYPKGHQPREPWHLRFFDRISWYPVGAEELLDLRADVAAGRARHDATDGVFRMREHQEFLRANASSISAFQAHQDAAFGVERAAWEAAGEFDPRPEPEAVAEGGSYDLPDGAVLLEAPFTSSVWRVDVRPGDRIGAGSPLLALEAMKMETVLSAHADVEVTDVLVAPGRQVAPGTPLMVLREVAA
ncbi:urea carboxylase [Kineococcus xinjiangensis]|uniref:Urea carboxylase n=1 Tax=Kineococcus xinjiangensis TaxID=512762 RepID=A0A2S6ISP7_9ACTN|nr:urea carboxylase [Kineococcus xinjiangensis]PPK97269.1 urea carboxylase [Kineococcus xinjiangensis]